MILNIVMWEPHVIVAKYKYFSSAIRTFKNLSCAAFGAVRHSDVNLSFYS